MEQRTHFDYLRQHIKNLADLYILDIGSGRGGFLIDVAGRGAKAIGLEINDAYIKEAFERAAEKGVQIKVINGAAENLPFEDSSFDFVNFALVIEHVENPLKVIYEMARVMKKGARAYMGVPNRFGFWDPHFHIYFVNWLPRSWANRFVTIFGKHKDYNGPAGRQSLEGMHYFTFGEIKKILAKSGFETSDIREEKLKEFFRISLIYWPILIVYRAHRFFFPDSFHLLLKKIR